MTTFTIGATEAKITSCGHNFIEIEFEAEKEDVMSLISIEEFIDYYGINSILDEIGDNR